MARRTQAEQYAIDHARSEKRDRARLAAQAAVIGLFVLACAIYWLIREWK